MESLIITLMVIILIFKIVNFFHKISRIKSRKVNSRRGHYTYNNSRYKNNMNHLNAQFFMDEMNRQNNQLFMDEMNRQNDQFFMDECMKSVTPWEMGGYDMNFGNSFNDFGGGMF